MLKGAKNIAEKIETTGKETFSISSYNDRLGKISEDLCLFFKTHQILFLELNNIMNEIVVVKNDLFDTAFLDNHLKTLSELLQFDDILNQKLKHIVDINTLITAKGNQLDKTLPVVRKEVFLSAQDVLLLNAEQLRSTAKEFNTIHLSFERIKKTAAMRMDKLSDELKYAVNVTDSDKILKTLKSFVDIKGDSPLERLSGLSTEFYKNIDLISKEIQKSTVSFAQISSVYTVDSERDVLERFLSSIKTSTEVINTSIERDQYGKLDLF